MKMFCWMRWRLNSRVYLQEGGGCGIARPVHGGIVAGFCVPTYVVRWRKDETDHPPVTEKASFLFTQAGAQVWPYT